MKLDLRREKVRAFASACGDPRRACVWRSTRLSALTFLSQKDLGAQLSCHRLESSWVPVSTPLLT